MTKFRTSNHNLPIETGRWKNIERADRLCTLCECEDVGDEYHYLFICNYFKQSRKTYLKPYYYTRPNTLQFQQFFNTRNSLEYHNLCKFIKLIMDPFK